MRIVFLFNLLLATQIGFGATSFEVDVNRLRIGLDQICDQQSTIAHNLVDLEQILSQFMGIDYSDLCGMSFEDKQEQLAICFSRICHNLAPSASGSGINLSVAIAQASAEAQRLLSYDDKNLINIEYFLNKILGISYHDLLTKSFDLKRQDYLEGITILSGGSTGQNLAFGLHSAGAISKGFDDSPVGISDGFDYSSFLSNPGISADGFDIAIDFDDGSGFDEHKGLDGSDYDDFILGDLGSDGALNRVNLLDNPIIGKYLGGSGYAMATMNLAIKNNKINARLLTLIPANIQPLITGCEIDFYTEILTWNRSTASLLDGSPVDFNAKNREFNLTFHGTMMSWFADKYPAYNFKTQNISENLEIGAFNFDGISQIIAMGSNVLNLQPVNPHDGHFSPDNTKIQVAADRNLVTLWSVAKSNEKKRAVVTYHILVNGDYYPDQADLITRACNFRNSLNNFISEIGQVEDYGVVFDGLDGVAWRAGVAFLLRLYQ